MGGFVWNAERCTIPLLPSGYRELYFISVAILFEFIFLAPGWIYSNRETLGGILAAVLSATSFVCFCLPPLPRSWD